MIANEHYNSTIPAGNIIKMYSISRNSIGKRKIRSRSSQRQHIRFGISHKKLSVIVELQRKGKNNPKKESEEENGQSFIRCAEQRTRPFG